MTSSPTPVASAVTLAIAASADELEAHFAVRRQVFVHDQRLFKGTDRDARDDEPATLHAIGMVDGEVVGAVRLYPLRGALWKGDRLAVLPEARVHQLGGQLVRFAVRTASACGGRRMIAHVQLPNVALLRAARMGARRRAGALRRRHAPADGDPASAARPVSGVRARSQAVASLPPDAIRRTRVSSKLPQAAHASPRRVKAAIAASACSGGAASRNPKLGNVSSQRSSGAPSGRGRAPTSSVAPARAPSIICSSEPAIPGIETSRAAWHRPCSATSTSASPSVRSRAGARSCSAVKNGRVSLMYRPSVANAAIRTSPGRAAEARSGRRANPVHEAAQRRRVPDREVPAHDRDAELVRRPGDPVQHGLGVRAVRRDEHVDHAERAAAHRAHVGDVRDHRRRAGAERVREQEGRRDRLAAEHQVPVAVRDERGVVAVDAGREALDDGEIALREQAGRRPDRLDQRVQICHPSH